jgi:hypothetical protein
MLTVVDDDQATAVAVAYVHSTTVTYSFFHSFMQMLGYDAERAGRVWRGGFVAERGGTGDLAHARNIGVRDFLAEPRADWLLWIDTDMGFPADIIDQLFDAADPAERPIMSALTFASREADPDGMGGWRPVAWPVIMDWTFVGERGGFAVRWDYERESVVRCDGIGSACVMVHRSVYERMRDQHGPDWIGWYSRVINPSTRELVSEDLSFCMRLMQLDIPVHVNTSAQTTHLKNVWVSEQDYWRQRALSPPPEEPVMPAVRTAPRYAVVPTHNRPARLLALVASLGPQVDYVVILDNASEPPADADALQLAAGSTPVTVLSDRQQPPHLSRFWNVLLDACAEDAATRGHTAWDVGVFNDDAIVPAGWFDVVSTVLRGHDTAAVAHTGTTPVHRHELHTEPIRDRAKRMCPWAFVTRGELGLRADEAMRWWYFDDDFSRQATAAGGVLAAPGPLVINAAANSSTVGPLADQADRDRETYMRKWSRDMAQVAG